MIGIKKLTADINYRGGLWSILTRNAAAGLCRGAGGKILEMCCGQGLLLDKLRQNNPGAELYGLDILEYAVDLARKALPKTVNLKIANASATGYGANFFDHIFCINAFINIASKQEIDNIFAEAARVLKPGGSFIADIRNTLFPLHHIMYGLVRLFGFDVSLVLFSTDTIVKIARSHGLRLEKKLAVGSLLGMFAPVFILKFEKQ